MDPKDEIKEKTDIVALVGEYLELKPAGMHSFRALCPFHSEKSPSFHVSSDRQIFHCFGCGEGGDVFSFVQKMEGMDFPEALLHLGKKCGIEVKRFSTAEGNTKQRLLQIHELAVSYYKKVLTDSSVAQTARDYLANRGITSELIEQFGLGFATDDWSRLSEVLLKRGFSETELIQAGLSLRKKTGSGLIDRFRSRVMIPLRDQHGNTVGFTGRVLPGANKDVAKYMNSPETPIYHKGRLLFGLDLAKRAIKEQKAVIVVEGNLDVVASHKAGVQNVVGSSGTAFTADQLELLKRYTQTVIFCFDRDAAGLTAAKKSVTIARSLGFDVRAITLPLEVKDPDELVQKNPYTWKILAGSSVPFVQFLLDRTLVDRDITNVDHKRLISQELLPVIAEIQDPIEREHWIQKLSSLLNIDVQVVRSAMKTKEKLTEATKVTEVTKKEKFSKKNQVILVLIGVLFRPDVNHTQIFEALAKIDIDQAHLAELYKFLRDVYNQANQTAKKISFAQIRSLLETHSQHEILLSLLDQSCLMAEQTFDMIAPNAVGSQLNTLFETLHSTDLHIKRSLIAQKLRQAEDVGNVEEIKKIMSELNKIS